MGQSFGVAAAAVAGILALSSPAYALNNPPRKRRRAIGMAHPLARQDVSVGMARLAFVS